MKELIQLSIGGCGINIGQELWKTLYEEHKDDEQHRSICFKETNKKQYLPRCVFIDPSNDGSISGNNNIDFNPDSFIFANYPQTNNFADAFYTKSEYLELVQDQIRNQAEECDSLMGFQIISSICGGSGSGITAKLREHLAHDFPQVDKQFNLLLPTKRYGECLVAPYNAICALNNLQGFCDQLILYDNNSLNIVAYKNLKQQHSNYDTLNKIMSVFLSGITSGIRLPGQGVTSLRKISQNLILFPSESLLMPSMTIQNYQPTPEYNYSGVENTIRQLYDPELFLVHCRQQSKFMAQYMSFRGNCKSCDINYYVGKFIIVRKKLYVDWVDYPISWTQSLQNKINQEPESATMLSNSTGITEMLKMITEAAHKMMSRKAYLYHYMQYGMDDLEFNQTLDNINQTISNYQDREGMGQYQENYE